MAQMTDDEKHDRKWSNEQAGISMDGITIVQNASNEALEYIGQVAENMDDKSWRMMAAKSVSLEMGAAMELAEDILPHVYEGMKKKMHKRLKIPKQEADVLIKIWLGRMMQTIARELHEANTRG